MVTPPPVAPKALEQAIREVQRDAAGRLAEDIACRNCGYNLRGLPVEGVCPECRTSVGRSIHGDLLRLSEPRWVDRLAQGAFWIIIGTLGGVGFMIVAGVLGAMLGAGGLITQKTMTVIMTCVSLVTASIMIFGFWLITEPDPGETESKPVNSRTVARYFLLFALVSAPLQAVLDPSGAMSNPTFATRLGGSYLILAAISVFALIGQAIGYIALFQHASRLALRIPSPGLSRQAVIVKYGYLSMQILGILTSISMLFALPQVIKVAAASGGSPNPSALFSGWFLTGVIFGCLAAPVTLIFLIWMIVLMFIFRNEFRRAADQARATWAGGG